MPKKRRQLTSQEIKALQTAFHHCQDGPTRTRYQAVWLYGLGYSMDCLVEITNSSRTTIMKWMQRYHQQGITGLGDGRPQREQSRLTDSQVTQLRRMLCQTTPLWTVVHFKRAVSLWLGVTYQSDSSYQKLFKRCDFTYNRAEKAYHPASEG